jgi:hypothetical protein
VGQVGNLRPIGNLLKRVPILFMTVFHQRRLPHLHSVGQPVFVTWRLHGSLPPNRVFSSDIDSGQAFAAMDRLLDNMSAGPLFLRMPDVANMVVKAIHYREDPDGNVPHFRLHVFVVMPNHVHLLVTPLVEMSKVMQSLKRYTAREGNRILGANRAALLAGRKL